MRYPSPSARAIAAYPYLDSSFIPPPSPRQSMPSLVPEASASAAFPPASPLCVRAKSSQPFPVHSPHTMPRSPYARSPQRHMWPQESLVPSLAIPSFPIDPALDNSGMRMVDERNRHLGHPHGAYIPGPPSVPAMPMLPPHYAQRRPPPVHMLSEFGEYEGLRMDPPVMQRTQSDSSVPFHPNDPHFLYYHQVPGPECHPGAWNAREVPHRNPPAPRQRSAKACQKCRKRKTKCSGGHPCTRCVSRVLVCEYDGKPTMRGSMKSRAQPPPIAPADSKGSDSPRTNARRDNRHQPYPSRSPSRPPSSPMSRQGSSQDGSLVPQVPQYLLGLTDGTPKAQENAGWPPLGVPMEGLMSPNDIEMAAMGNPAFATGGYPLPAHVAHHGKSMGMSWSRHPSEEGEGSDSSRPPSACSVSSLSSSDGSYGRGHVWSASGSEHFQNPSVPPPLSTCSSSSSLKDALVEVPRRQPSVASSQSRAASFPAAPIPGSDPNSAEFAATLTHILNNTSITEDLDATGPGALLQLTSSPAATAGLSPDSGTAWSSAVPSPVTPASPPALQFEDVFNLSPSTSRTRVSVSASASIASVLSDAANHAAPWPTVSPECTIRARGDGLQNARTEAQCYADATPLMGGAPPCDKTPRPLQSYYFEGEGGFGGAPVLVHS